MSTNQTEKKTILVVDDDPFIQRLFRRTLEREGFNILSAVDGTDAIGMLPTLTADLIILDLMLPKINGLKVLESIRTDHRIKDVPVLILSNAYLPEVARKAMKAGANLGLPKSECSPTRLVELVRQMAAVPEEENDKQPAARKSLFSRFLSGKPENPRQGGDMTTKSADNLILPEARNELAKDWQTDVAAIRQQCVSFVKSVGSQESAEHLNNLYRSLRLVSARAAMGRCTNVCQLANAFEAMLFEHVFRLKTEMSPSVTQTMVQAVDCLEHLFKSGAAMSLKAPAKSKILLVDDDPICNSANDIALRRADFETVSATDGMAALALCESRHFDLILLDINMPVLNGFEVCEQIRAFPLNKHTPVIFVTLHGDFQNRAQSVLSGASGLITKPISPLELIVKAMVFLLRSEKHHAAKEPSHTHKHAAHAPPTTAKQTEEPATIALRSAAAPSRMQLAAPTVAKPVSKKAEGHPTHRFAKEQPKLEGRVKELQATQAAVDERVKALTEALATETKRREEAEKQAAANAKRRIELEGALVENQIAHKSFEELLEKTRQQAQTRPTGQNPLALDGQARELELVRIFVEQKNNALAQAIAAETKRREAAEKQAAEYSQRRSELETALASCQEAKDGLLREIDAAGNPGRRSELEAALRENARTQTTLLAEMEETRQKLQPPTPETTTVSAAETQIAELKAALAAVEAKVKSLSDDLAEERKRRESAEQQAAEINKHHRQLEAELAGNQRTQLQVRQDLEDAQKQLQALTRKAVAEQSKLAAKEKDLATAQKAAEAAAAEQTGIRQQMQTLTGSLKGELGRRQSAEKQAAELAARRNELEQELAQRTRAQQEMRAELLEQQNRLDAQAKHRQAEQATLAARTKELAVAQTGLAQLKAEHEGVVALSHSLTGSLKTESSQRKAIEKQAADLATRRAELEQTLTRRMQEQEHLQSELVEHREQLGMQHQTHQAELANLTRRTVELETAHAALAELKARHASVGKQADSLAASLKTESARREAVEKQAAELAERRTELERSLAERTQAQERLQTELAAQQKLLAARGQTHQVELASLQQRTNELETTQTALAELKARHAEVTHQSKSLAGSLATESSRRNTVEKQAAELVARRVELERELALQARSQKQLRAALDEQQERFDAQTQIQREGEAALVARTKDLEASQATATELSAQLAIVRQQVQTLNESLKDESARREIAEKQAAELSVRRAALEQELTRRTQAQEQLQAEVADQRKQLAAHARRQQRERTSLSARTEELEAAQAALTELKIQHAQLNDQVNTLTNSLTSEAVRREAAEKQATELTARRAHLEADLARRTHAQEQLRGELAGLQTKLDSEAHAHTVEIGQLAAKTGELKIAQAAFAELRVQHASVSEQVGTLTKTLRAESARRKALEKQATDLAAGRAELENELSQRTQAQHRLSTDLEEQQHRLQAQGQTHQAEIQILSTRLQELETAKTALAELTKQHEIVQRQAASLADSLKGETSLREIAEQQAAELVARRTDLEHELAEKTWAQEQSCASLAAQQQRLDAQGHAHEADLEKLAARTHEMESVQAELLELKDLHARVCQRTESLTSTLTAESVRRETLEQQAAELLSHRGKLEQELAQHSQIQEQLRAEVAGQQQRLNVTAAELDGFRNRDAIQVLKQQRLAEQLVDSDGARNELANQLAASRALAAGHESAIQTLGTKLQRRTDEFERLDMLLRTEVVHRHRLQSQLANAESQLAGFGRQLVQKNAAEQSWLRRESELQTRLRFHQGEAVQAGAALAAREVEIRQARAKIEELQVLQSALCTKVRELACTDEAATAQIQELKENISQSANTAAQRQKHLAAMRYAILDASRTSLRRQRERSQAGQQQLAALKQLLWTFENTPLATAQRRMLTEIQNSISNLTNHGADEGSPYPVELPELHQGEFCAAEVIEGAFRIVRTRSGETGIAARTSASGATGGTLYGDAVYIHQLIVLLAASPLGMEDVSALDLRVAIERMTASSADLTVRVALSTKTSTQSLRARIECIAAASANLKAGSFGEPEAGLAAGWQLAQALGAQAAIETEGDGEACLTLSLPIEMKSRVAATTDLPAPPNPANGDDHDLNNVLAIVPAR